MDLLNKSTLQKCLKGRLQAGTVHSVGRTVFISYRHLWNKKQKVNWAKKVFVIQAIKLKVKQGANSVTASLGLQTCRDQDMQGRQLVAKANPIFTISEQSLHTGHLSKLGLSTNRSNSLEKMRLQFASLGHACANTQVCVLNWPSQHPTLGRWTDCKTRAVKQNIGIHKWLVIVTADFSEIYYFTSYTSSIL